MDDPLELLIEKHKKQFKADLARRRSVREQEREFSSLGEEVIDRSFRKLVEKIAPEFDLDALDKENRALSKKLERRVEKAVKEMRKMPNEASKSAIRHNRMMQKTALTYHHSGCIPPPPDSIVCDPDGSNTGRNRCEVTANAALARIYPAINVYGHGRSGMRDAEVTCDFLWTFIPDRSERHWITPHIEIHGFQVITLEHHCGHSSTGTTRELEILMDVSQSGVATPNSIAGPVNLGHGRIDTWRWPNYSSVFLRRGIETEVLVRIRLRAAARCRYARSEMNFGDPPSDNFIGIPWLCWMGFSEFS